MLIGCCGWVFGGLVVGRNWMYLFMFWFFFVDRIGSVLLWWGVVYCDDVI